jgi:hypothetical protein
MVNHSQSCLMVMADGAGSWCWLMVLVDGVWLMVLVHV